jgi:hypothetical protein
VTGYLSDQYAGNYSFEAYVVSAASGCANAAAHNASCGQGAAAGLISRGASEVGAETGYDYTAAAVGGCASSRVTGGSCTDGAAAALGSTAMTYVVSDLAQTMKAEYARYSYRSNSYALLPVAAGLVLTEAGGGAAAGFWTWLVGSGAAATAGAPEFDTKSSFPDFLPTQPQ